MSIANRDDVSQLFELLDRIPPCEDAAPASTTQPAELAATTPRPLTCCLMCCRRRETSFT